MSGADPLERERELEARLALHRDELWAIGIRAALRFAESARRYRRSRWQARRAVWLLQQRELRGAATKTAPPRRKSRRRRSRATLAVVR